MPQQDFDRRRNELGDDDDQTRQSPEQRGMTASGRSRSLQRGEGGEGNWTGYVVPYRYYGPGYRGVGYYSVLYQGPGTQGQGEDDDEMGHPYGQGSGAGRAWSDRASSMAAFSRSSGWGGGHAGRGPKGYRRSDDRIREDVSDRLMADDQLDASEIEVQVRDAEVTLSGTVEDRWAKRRAEDVAEQVMGVRDVMNKLRVEGYSASQSNRSTEISRSRATPETKEVARGSAGGSTQRPAAQTRNGSSRSTAGSR
jgi:osmotically-inducible protein OsmY